MKTCTNCVLQENFPGIRFGSDGVCQHCLVYGRSSAEGEALKKEYADKFFRVLEQVKISRSAYDAVMAYSGGKDSSYVLSFLKGRLGLKVLAVTFDNGFIPTQANRNIQAIVRKLRIDHITMRPDREALFSAFRESVTQKPYSMKTLQRASAICNTCMYLIKSFLLKTAIEMEIPSIVYGWSPGQVPVQSSVAQINPAMTRRTQHALSGALSKIIGEELRSLTVRERHLKALETREKQSAFIYNLSPLAFMHYNESEIIEEIKSLGWLPPKDTDPNSTNCLLNVFANHVHLREYGFHAYAFEVAGLVRAGYMSREAGLSKLEARPDKKMIDTIAGKLKLENNLEAGVD